MTAGQVLCEEPVPVFFHESGMIPTVILQGQKTIKKEFPFFDQLHAEPSEFKTFWYHQVGIEKDDLLTLERVEVNGFDAGDRSLGLSLFVSMASHRCDANSMYGVRAASHTNSTPILKAVATRDILKGEEVTICYGPCETLFDRYNFTPDCVKACEDYELSEVQQKFVEELYTYPVGKNKIYL